MNFKPGIATLVLLMGAAHPALDAQTGTPTSSSPTQQQFMDYDSLKHIDITIDADDWTNLLLNYEDNTYYHGTFTWHGISMTTGIRQRGATSRSPLKPNLDINFAHYTKTQAFLGLPFIILKANNEDASNMREWLCMNLFRQMGFPAPREVPAELTINGQHFGFYYIVEHLDETFLQRNYGESGGYLYEFEQNGSYEFENLGADSSLYAPLLDLKTKQDSADLQTFANLVAVINQISNPSFNDADFVSALSMYIDPKQFLSYAAAENVLGEQDGLVGGIVGMNNFYLYQLAGTTLYQLIPWDKDLTFAVWNRDLLTGFTIQPCINVLAQRLTAMPEYYSFYLSQVNKAIGILGGQGGWADNLVTKELGIIAESASNDPYKQCATNGVLYSCGTADFLASAGDLQAVLATRAPFVQQELQAYGSQIIAGAPTITSVAIAGDDPTVAITAGAVVDLFGTNLGPSAQVPDGGSMPYKMIGTFVAVNGLRSQLAFTSDGQIEFQLPAVLPPGNAHIVVSVFGNLSNTFELQLQKPAEVTVPAQ
ncbi:MAG TPA: CotH kinase family protein [Bryobacteraceae bacterium]|jgi:hypothetical protein